MTRVLVTKPGCGGCDQARERLAELGKDDDYREISVTNPIGETIAEKLGLRMFPACVEIGDGEARECDIYDALEWPAPGDEALEDPDQFRLSDDELARVHKELSALTAE